MVEDDGAHYTIKGEQVRIRYPKTDENHKLVSRVMKDVYGAVYEFGAWYADIQGVRVVAIDTSKHGGSMLDWLLIIDREVFFIEIKMPGKEKTLTEGEKYFLRNSEANKAIIVSEQEFIDLLQRVISE